MPRPNIQKVFAFYEDEQGLKRLAADLKPHIRRIVDKRCTKGLADLGIDVAYLQCRIDELWQRLDEHIRSHQAETDAADWWKHGGDPS